MINVLTDKRIAKYIMLVQFLMSICMHACLSVRVRIYIYIMYKSGLKSSYDGIISAVDDFLTNGIQTPQHRWKKCVDCKGYYVEKLTSYGHFPRKYLGQPKKTFQLNHIYIYIYDVPSITFQALLYRHLELS